MTEIDTICPYCGVRVEVKDGSCPRCEKFPAILKFETDEFKSEGLLNQCPVCGAKPLYRQKDFNRRLGVLLLVVGVFFSYMTYGLSLVILALFDVILYRSVKEIGTCYQCGTVFRNNDHIKKLEPFNLSIHDYFRNLKK